MTDLKSDDKDIEDVGHLDSSEASGKTMLPEIHDEEKKPQAELTKEQTFLKEYFARALGLRPPPKQVLSTLDIEGIAKLILEGKAKNIITMAGAGISTSAGIPDFRSPKTGLYDNLDKFNLPNPQAIFSLDYFKENPVPYFTVRKEMLLGNYKPTLCHYFVRMLADRGLLLRHYTQNIDGLERIAGIDPDMMVEAHGSNRMGHCLECSAEYTHTWIKNILRRDQIPKCSAQGCSGIIKPDTVFFGERLPSRFFELTEQDFEQCDLLIILGTSLKVQPFAKLPINVPDETPRLYINMEKNVSDTKHPLAVLIFGGGFKFDDEDNYRDVFLQSPCDEGCSKLADLLGWEEELRTLVTEEHSKLDQEFKEDEQNCEIEASTSATKVPVSSTLVPVITTQEPVITTQTQASAVKSSGNKCHSTKTSQVEQKKRGTKMKPNASRDRKSSARTIKD